MRLILLVLNCCLLSTFIICQPVSQAHKFTIAGQIAGQDDGYIHLYYTGSDDKHIHDSALIIDHHFSFKGQLLHPVRADLVGNVRSISINDPNATEVFIEPGNIGIDIAAGNFKKAAITGSNSQAEYQLYEHNFPDRTGMESLSVLFDRANDSLRHDRSNQALNERITHYRMLLEPYIQTYRQYELKYICTYPDSYVSAYIMRNGWIDRLPIDSLKLIFGRFTKRIQASRDGQRINDRIMAIDAGSAGSFAANFTTKDINGNTVSLSSFKGKKYVLLDFWASWCVPCRENTPRLLALYEGYKKYGLEVMGISSDIKGLTGWKEAIAADKTGMWTHVAMGFGTVNDLGRKFGVQGIPVYILIDKTGKILYRDENQSKDALETAFKQIAKE